LLPRAPGSSFARSGDKLLRAAHEVGRGATALPVDIGDDAAIEAAFAGEPFDHVAITAAQTVAGGVRGMSLDDAYKSMNSKFWGAYRVARAARITNTGSLTFISGGLAVRPSKASVLQGAINAALEGLARGLALELAPVRVNAVSPGTIMDPQHGMRCSSPPLNGPQPGVSARPTTSQTPSCLSPRADSSPGPLSVSTEVLQSREAAGAIVRARFKNPRIAGIGPEVVCTDA